MGRSVGRGQLQLQAFGDAVVGDSGNGTGSSGGGGGGGGALNLLGLLACISLLHCFKRKNED